MRSHLDELLDRLNADYSNVYDVCTAITEAIRQNPVGTSMWGMLIETRTKQQKLPLTVSRALLDATDPFESEKTMWLAPKREQAASTNAPTTASIAKPHAATDANRKASDEINVADVLHDGAIAGSNLPAKNKSSAPRPPGVGMTVNNRYLLESKLGNGCMGQVFTATDLAAENTGVSDSRVIVEVVAVDLNQESEALVSLKDAVSRIKQLNHQNIVRVFGVEQADGQVSVVMEHLKGRWLADIIRQARKEPLALAAAWSLIEGISSGLAHAHKRGMVHSNLNPCSIFVTDAGVPKIMGFELIDALPTGAEAIELLDTMTLRAYSEAYTTQMVETPGKATPVDDLYPLGVIAYELLTGKHPFQRHSLDVARLKQLSYEPVPDLPPRAAKLLAECLSFERAARPADAARFVKRLQGPTLLRFMFGDKYSALGTSSVALTRG
jgi:non-specific serine/threonine protein kinase